MKDWQETGRPAGEADINHRLIMLLRDLSHIMRSLYEGKGSQSRVLIVLDELGGTVTQRELTRRLGIQPGSASEVIAKLEQAGYIVRTPSETDRRTADVSLTAEGKAQAAVAGSRRIRRHLEMFACLSEEEKRQLLGLLEKLHTDWDGRYQGAGQSGRRHGHGHGHEHGHGPGPGGHRRGDKGE